ncbi:MAG TPA: MerR family transcriptional regulator [Bacteroidales bacterium]|jgi:DNA-binding transcriptional MerR regulator|nr:MerR family transcriptional regulator [Bacteroidales bacterium]HOF15371.1 MerR family transcriptional regulator [Bacteroidales bacterium]HON21259.1 MerR family transcriptional regulator [Bacteroidales bacterium]HOR81135.1 MerR family transcriptional regulator [Bacteroidales bacterium]HPJ90743.1 MerR family transcriptional regulator [Bacteroidales bacterium]
MSYKEKNREKTYYSIGEVAKMFNVNTSLIRFWEKEFDVLKPFKNKKGNRYFTAEDIKILNTIFYLVKEKGYTLQGAKEKLTNNKNKAEANAEIHQSLNKIKQFLLDIKSDL